MKRKSLVVVAISVVLLGLLNMVWSANKARDTSDKILRDFKLIDASLNKSNDSLQKVNDSVALSVHKRLSIKNYSTLTITPTMLQAYGEPEKIEEG